MYYSVFLSIWNAQPISFTLHTHTQTALTTVNMAVCALKVLWKDKGSFKWTWYTHSRTRLHKPWHTHSYSPLILLYGCQWCGLIRKARGRVLSTHRTATFIDSIYTHTYTHTHTHKLTPIFTTRTGTHNNPLTILLAPNRFSHFTL